MPARRSFRSSPIRSTRSGPTGRRRRSARWCCTICASPAKRPAAKLDKIRAEIASLRADALVVSDPHAVAWTFNIRGSDVAHTPLPIAFAIVPKQGRPTLYIDSAKFSNAVRHKLEEATEVREPAAFVGDLKALGQAHRTVRLDQATGADALSRIIGEAGGKVTRGLDPIAMMKAVKNHGRDRGRARRAPRATARR